MQDSSSHNLYTIWDWYNAPYLIRSYAPLHWEKGSWIIRVVPGYDFSFGELPITLREDCEVVQTEIEGCSYLFVKDPKNLPWPPPNLKGFAFGTAATSDLPFSRSYQLLESDAPAEE